MAEPLAVLDGLMHDVLTADQNEADQAMEASTRRLAAMTVRRDVLRHPCTGKSCRHRNHRRDRLHAELLFEALELPGDLAVPEDYGARILWGSFSREEVKLLH